MKIDLHCHTIYSKHWFWGRDALDTPQQMVKTAIRKGLNGLAITDHQTVRGGIAAEKYAKRKKFILIPGIEIRTASGDLLGLNIRENVKDDMPLNETIEKIHALGGIAAAPHPFAKFLIRKCVGLEAVKADAIEVFNAGSCRKFQDKKALRLALANNKPKTAGSDAHSYRDVGNAGIICNASSKDDIIEDILKNRVKIFGNYTHWWNLSMLTAEKFSKSLKHRLAKLF